MAWVPTRRKSPRQVENLETAAEATERRSAEAQKRRALELWMPPKAKQPLPTTGVTLRVGGEICKMIWHKGGGTCCFGNVVHAADDDDDDDEDEGWWGGLKDIENLSRFDGWFRMEGMLFCSLSA